MKAIMVIVILLVGIGIGWFLFGNKIMPGTQQRSQVVTQNYNTHIMPLDADSVKNAYETLKKSGKESITMEDILSQESLKLNKSNSKTASAIAARIGNYLYATCFSVESSGSWSYIGSGWINTKEDYFNATGGVYWNWDSGSDVVCFDWGGKGEI